MKNRPDIACLTIIGLSLTVVITVYNDNSLTKNGLFRLSANHQHHIQILPADLFCSVFDLELVVSKKSENRIYIYDYRAFKAIVDNDHPFEPTFLLASSIAILQLHVCEPPIKYNYTARAGPFAV